MNIRFQNKFRSSRSCVILLRKQTRVLTKRLESKVEDDGKVKDYRQKDPGKPPAWDIQDYQLGVGPGENEQNKYTNIYWQTLLDLGDGGDP